MVSRYNVISVFVFAFVFSISQSASGFEKTKLTCNVAGQGPKLSRVEYDRMLKRVELITPTGEITVLMSGLVNSRRNCIWADKFIPAFGVNPDTYQASLKCANGIYYGISILDGASRKGLYMKRSADGLHREMLYLAACE